ncbi:MAG: hypothetical protein F4027_03160 [Rhodospirillaceae bacterium]|nr:hypothetical protein [Rhodospirillaceae bacterium]MYF85623.1 hypothetical protein [Rhodospirillaceae bacterium]MYH36976.1 hypothetical protein [Rhodospirillaceae bacterium]MYK16501.1 hypothetical protein [Rhodospirillaceae bacterium]MYK57640.1 hypothetical protein [Rhodospirillaceae bacterium]
MADDFFERGWTTFGAEPDVLDWLDASEAAARRSVTDPAFDQWHRCGGTWFAGVNALANDETGAVAGGPPLGGAAVRFVEDMAGGPFAWDRAQVSVCWPGYPKQGEGESDSAFAYRRKRDAAHVDGLLPVGPERRRFLREHHRFILGLPVGPADPAASPFVLWEGSHRMVRETLTAAFGDRPPASWRDIDVTGVYHALRRRIFAECRRVVVTAGRGEAFLVHRLALHGIAPWRGEAAAGERMIVYFRPESGDPAAWLHAP